MVCKSSIYPPELIQSRNHIDLLMFMVNAKAMVKIKTNSQLLITEVNFKVLNRNPNLTVQISFNLKCCSYKFTWCCEINLHLWTIRHSNTVEVVYIITALNLVWEDRTNFTPGHQMKSSYMFSIVEKPPPPLHLINLWWLVLLCLESFLSPTK